MTEYIEINQKRVPRLPDRPRDTLPGGAGGRRQVFIIGSKGIPARYGGFETFVEHLTAYQQSDQICYHVARIASDTLRYMYNGAECFDVKTPPIGPARAVWYDAAALCAALRWCRDNPGAQQPVFYVLACRIGPFIGALKRRIKGLGGVLYVNPDGHEWKRSKWSRPVRWYWRWSERQMVKHADLVVCDSVCIQRCICRDHRLPPEKTVFIAYGAEQKASGPEDGGYDRWLRDHGVAAGGYYLAVSRFVPENNFETMIREFMHSCVKRDFVIVTTKDARFFRRLEKKLHFSADKRIKFVGTVYEAELLRAIRENAYANLHGHEVGGTNPSLLEALESTRVNLLLDVEFNREVAGQAALYWTKERGSLAALLEKAEGLSRSERDSLGARAKRRIAERYRWEDIVRRCETLFLTNQAGPV